MDVIPSTSRCNSTVTKQYSGLEIELYYLIAKYLSAGPCQKAYEVLKAEIEDNQLLPNRYDWLGNEQKKTFEELDGENIHLRNDHLARMVARLGPAINQLVPLVHSATFPTLLGAGSQSLLRTDQDLCKSYRSLKSVVVRMSGGRPPLEPLRVCGPPSLTHIVVGRELSGTLRQHHIHTNEFHRRMDLLLRSIGHLSAVYCMLFDKTGKYIITGADDTLVKIWSTLDGRLLATLRGASAEISDLAIDSENTLIAAGSCDKIIRVWSLQTLAPIAVLTSHTGMVTAVQFCPAPDNEGVLVSTGGDGCVAFWTYTRRAGEVKFDSKPLKVNERVRPGNAQLICASFSQGGHFLALGGADHFVRVYQLGGEEGVDKLLETERHTDRVDSIQWCHRGLTFVSGSRDGTALIWHYERQQWKNIILNMADRFPGDSPTMEDLRRLQVTMVGWNRSDKYVITASNDKCLRVWESSTGRLRHILRGHEDNAYVIEAHPFQARLVLSAAHDGQLMIWDILTGSLVWSFKNTIEGQGYGALFDAKWSPDGFTIAATDSHGHLMLFGIGHNEKFQQIPKELFFHTDYRPLMRDGNNHVLDEQTQMAPHLMPPPFLVNMDGDPYPPEYQRLVPGRESCRHDQLIPNVLLNANGDQEVLDVVLVDVESGSVPPPTPVSAPTPMPAQLQDPTGQRPSIDDMIQRLAQEQDQRIGVDHNPSEGDQAGPSEVRERRESSGGSRRGGERRPSSTAPGGDHSYAVAAQHDPLSPRANRVGARRVGDVEGVRQSTGNWQRDPHMKWKHRTIVRRLNKSDFERSVDMRVVLGEMELQEFEEESRKKPEPVRSPQHHHHHETNKRSRKKQKKQTHSYSTRSIRDTSRGSFERQEFEEAENAAASSSSGSSSGSEVENEELQESTSSDEQSTDYSDWTAEAGVNLEPPKRTAHKQRKNPKKTRRGRRSTDDEEQREQKDEEDEEDEEDKTKRKAGVTPAPRLQRKQRGPRLNLSEISSGGADEIPEEYRPPEWLTEIYPKKAPYFPQMGDELIYFMQGHMLYVEAVMNRHLYTVDQRSLPWMRTVNKLRHQEFVKIIGIKYEIKPPRLCCLKLGIMEAGSGRLMADSFTIKYHDMPDVLDFLVLKITYDVAVNRHWKSGDRFRCIIDDAWWLGSVESQEPHLPEFQDSMFMCYRVLWDNGERERLSPWDMELIDDNTMAAVELGGSVTVKQEELEELLYSPQDEEWAGRDPDLECDRISHGLSKIMSLSIAEPFLVPVDLNVYPTYALIIDYPMDLTTIKSRLDNRFYRRINAVQFDVRYIATNTEKFNQRGSNIVRQARIVTELCLELIKDGLCTDPTLIYHELQANYHSPDHSDNPDHVQEGAGGGKGGQGRSSNTKGGLKGKGQARVDNRSWQQKCKDLLRSIFEREDSMPFRYPVDLERYPDYSQVIDVPMDLTTVREELSANGYSTPHDFAKDVRLIFTNSKNYNTNKRSRIYSMTLRLEAYFEDQIRPILSGHKSQGKRNLSKSSPRTTKRKVPPVTIKVVGGKATMPQTGGGSQRSSPAQTQGHGTGGLLRRPPTASSSTYITPTAAIRKGGGGKTGGPRIKNTPPKTSTESRRTVTSFTSFGRVVVPPPRSFSLSPTLDNAIGFHDDDYDDDELEASITKASGKDKKRRSRRVARKKILNGEEEEEDNDSGEEYSPRNRPTKTPPKSKKKGVATRNRGRVTVQYNEETDEEEVPPRVPPMVPMSHLGNLKKKVAAVKSENSSNSGSESESSGCDGVSPNAKRTNGQLSVIRNRVESSSDESVEKRSKKSKSVNGIAKKISEKSKKVGKRKDVSEGSDSEGNSSSSSSSDEDSPSLKPIKKSGGSVKKKKVSSSSDSSSSEKKKKPTKRSPVRKLPQLDIKQGHSKRQMKDESEVEFDDEDLESSSEESLEQERSSKKSSRKRGVASGVRRARKIIHEDVEEESDFIVDKDFIDDADVTATEVSTSDSESEDASDYGSKKSKKKKKKRAKPKARPKAKPVKKKRKKTPSKNSKNTTPRKKATPKKKSPPKKTSTPATTKTSPAKKRPTKKMEVQEFISVSKAGQDPIPYQPINFPAQKVIVNEVKHKGRVVGRVITSQYGGDEVEEDSSEESSTEEESDLNQAAPYARGTVQQVKGEGSVKRAFESGSESEERVRSMKKLRYSDDEDEDESEEVDVSSRGRVRKANTLMRDFI